MSLVKRLSGWAISPNPGNEVPVKSCKADEEPPNFLSISGRGKFLNGCCQPFLWFYSFCWKIVPQKLDIFCSKDTFRRFQRYICCSQSLKHQLYIHQMLFKICTRNDDIVYLRKNAVWWKPWQTDIHKPLVRCTCLAQSIRGFVELEFPQGTVNAVFSLLSSASGMDQYAAAASNLVQYLQSSILSMIYRQANQR